MTAPAADQTTQHNQPLAAAPKNTAPAGCAGCLKAQLGQCARQLAAQKSQATRPGETPTLIQLPQLKH